MPNIILLKIIELQNIRTLKNEILGQILLIFLKNCQLYSKKTWGWLSAGKNRLLEIAPFPYKTREL